MSGPTTIDLFAGCGGMTVGFTREGFKPILGVEFNKWAAATYAANFGVDHTWYGDINDFPDDKIPDADVVIGGPPCQGFSNLGSKDVNDPRNQLWKQYMRFVQVARPDVFVLENVQRFSAASEFQLLLAEADHGMLKDYHLEWGVLLAADYGVAQRRPRTIVIGSRKNKYKTPIKLPVRTHSRTPLSEERPWETVRSRIAGLPEKPEFTDMPASVTNFFGIDMPGVFKGVDLHFGRNPRQLSLDRYKHVPPGGGRFNVPDHLLPRCWRDKATGTTDVMGRMRWDAPSLTIRTEFYKPEKGQYLHPQWEEGREDRQVNRVITHYEASLLQDFPKDFLWVGPKTEIARQIGNAVPAGLAQAIAHQIKQHLV
ncbi:DNA cytosine methyltransferase [Kineococcus sp. R86509]|uniref:DNA cytosine methyltransferase n=1 Tax=Kineococcus sp. R86509 TaxID=3093851 RepID=UPI0036D2394A